MKGGGGGGGMPTFEGEKKDLFHIIHTWSYFHIPVFVHNIKSLQILGVVRPLSMF